MENQGMSRARFLLLVTGASRGFGRRVAEEFVRQVAPAKPVDVVLVARSESGLQSATDALEEIAKTIHASGGVADVVVRREALDLGDLDRLEAGLKGVFSRIDPLRYSRAILVNNAGSLGHISMANELPSLAKLRSEVDFNITSAIWLSSRFAAVFGAKKREYNGGSFPSGEFVGASGVDGPAEEVGANNSSAAGASVEGGAMHVASQNVVVNISSLAALQPFENWGGYSSGKAARDMFHSVLAKEQASVGGLMVLNYAPGPMDTDMSREIRSPEEYDDDLHSGKLIDPRLSAEKCVRLAIGLKFVTGSHVDYFDEEEE